MDQEPRGRVIEALKLEVPNPPPARLRFGTKRPGIVAEVVSRSGELESCATPAKKP